MSDADPKAPAIELDDEAKVLQLLKIKAESRKAIAEASVATGKAVAPTVGADALRSTLDIGEGGGPTLTTIVASEQLSRVARRIAEGVATDARDARVFIIEDLSIADDDAGYLLVTDRLEAFREALETAKALFKEEPEDERLFMAAPVTLAALPAVISATSSLVSTIGGFLKSEYSISSSKVAISRTALLATLLTQLRRQGIHAELPGLRLIKESRLVQSLHTLIEKRSELENLVARADFYELQPRIQEIDALIKYIGDLRTVHVKLLSEGKLAEAEKVRGLIDTEASELANLTGQESFQKTRAAAATARSLITAFDAFLTSINTVPPGRGYAPLMSAVLREQLHSSDDETYLLYVEVTAAGGEVISKPGWAWKDPFASFLGAVEASYVLASPHGTIKSSARVTRYGSATFDFKKFELDLKDQARRPTSPAGPPAD